MNTAVDTTVTLTGILPAVMIASAVLTALVAMFLLWLYRRAVMRAMGTTSGAADMQQPSADLEAESGVDSPALAITTLDVGAGAVESHPAEKSYWEASRSLRRAALVYLAGGLAYALVFALAWLVVSKGGFIAVRFVWLFICCSWPIVLALGLVAVIDPRRHATIAGVASGVCLGSTQRTFVP